MKNWPRTLLMSAVLGLSLSAFASPTTKGDDYWDNYWSWYDGTYRPYYSRHYRAPRYRYDAPRYYGRPYYGGRYYYDGRVYYPPSRYYGPSRYGYRTYPGGGVRVGPLRFGWW